jgi:hypothetical protein
MSRKTSLNIPNVFCAGLALAAIVVSLGAPSATAAGADHRRLGKPLPHCHHFYAMYRGPSFAPPAALPHAPEYGFLRRVPANAIGGPGYTFVPGVGILGESCDLPTSACTNEYRDVQ